jgi:nickel transport protein
MKQKIILQKCLLLLILIAFLCLPLIAAGSAYAHGVELEYSILEAVQVTARYDSGSPLAGAQVAVFAPGNPAEPWLTGTCDSEGRFLFVPESTLPGLWEVQVRQAGHGGLIRVNVAEGAPSQTTLGGFNTTQKAVMAAAVIWGLVGTALYFSRRRI